MSRLYIPLLYYYKKYAQDIKTKSVWLLILLYDERRVHEQGKRVLISWLQILSQLKSFFV
jgi:hypothetical protein